MNVKVEVGDVHLHNLRQKELSMALFVNNLSGRLTLMCAGYLCCWVRNNKRFLIYTKFPSFKYSCKKVKKKQKWCLCGVGEMVDITLEQNCYIWCGMELGTPVFASEQRNPLYRHMRAGLAYLLQISVRQIWGKLCQFANIKVSTNVATICCSEAGISSNWLFLHRTVRAIMSQRNWPELTNKTLSVPVKWEQQQGGNKTI